MELGGPVAGHDRLKTSADASGKKVLGMINNCARRLDALGHHPDRRKRTSISISAAIPPARRRPTNYKRYGMKGEPSYPWGKFVDRFDVTKEPNEPNRFGWIVEVNPYDPDFSRR